MTDKKDVLSGIFTPYGTYALPYNNRTSDSQHKQQLEKSTIRAGKPKIIRIVPIGRSRCDIIIQNIGDSILPAGRLVGKFRQSNGIVSTFSTLTASLSLEPGEKAELSGYIFDTGTVDKLYYTSEKLSEDILMEGVSVTKGFFLGIRLVKN